jgi:hypothetical protein
MNTDLIVTLATAIPAILGALTAMIWAVRGKQVANVALKSAVHANNAVITHVVETHNAFPIQPPTETETPAL